MRHILAAALLLLVLGTAGCGKKETGATSGKPTVAVIPKGTTHEFWKSIHAGALKAGEEQGIEIIWKGPLKEDDREAQISVVEDFISRNVAGIVLAPLDDAALRAPVAGAMQAGIPVVIIDSDLQGSDYISFVATDNFLGGQLAGKKMIELLGGKGKVVMLRYQEGSASTAKREAGFLNAIGEAPGITVVNASQFGGATTETAYKASENLLAPLRRAGGKLSIDGIFTPNESTTFGMLRALQDAGLAGTAIFLGFDSSPKLIEALEKGELNGLVLQNPFRMGYLGVTTLADHLKGGKVARRIDTGVTMATKENMKDLRDLLSPDLSRWLK